MPAQSYLYDRIFGQDSFRVICSLGVFILSTIPSAFTTHILAIVFGSSFEQMFPIYAWWIVAYMQDESFTNSVMIVADAIGYPMSHVSLSLHIESSVFLATSLPWPAYVWGQLFRDAREKTHQIFCGKFWDWFTIKNGHVASLTGHVFGAISVQSGMA